MVHSKSLATAQCERNIQQQALEKQKYLEELERARLADFEAESTVQSGNELQMRLRFCLGRILRIMETYCGMQQSYKIVSRTLGSSRGGGH